MKQRLLVAVLLFLHVAAFSQALTFQTVAGSTKSIRLSDFATGVTNAGNTSVTLVSIDATNTVVIPMSSSAFVTAANGEFVSVTSGKAQGGYANGQTVLFHRNTIKLFAPATGNKTMITTTGRTSSFLANETFAALSSTLSSVPSGSGGSSPTNLSYTASTGVMASSTGTSATIPLATGSVRGLLDASEKTFFNNAPTFFGVPLSSTGLGTFTGQVLGSASNPSVKGAIQTTATAIETVSNAKQDNVVFRDEGANVAGTSSGTVTKLNFVGSGVTATQDGTDLTQVNVTISGGGGATTNTLTAASSAITSTVNGVASTITPSVGTIAQNLGFDGSGNLVKATPASGVYQYDAGSGVFVTATATGATATKASGIWTVTFPTGCNPISCSVNVVSTDIQTSADGAGSVNWVRIVFTGAGVQTGGSHGTMRLPQMQTMVVPIGTVAVTNTININTTNQTFSAIGANTLTARKINMSNTDNHVLSFSNF